MGISQHDWVIRARRYDYRLSSGAPVYCHPGDHPAPTRLELDIHDGFEVGVLLTGREERHFQGYILDCAPGDVWMCAMWEPHGWRVTEHGTRNAVFVFLPEFLGEETIEGVTWLSLFAAPPERRPRIASSSGRAETLEVGRLLRREIEDRSRGWLTSVRLNLLRLLLAVARQWPEIPAPGVSPPQVKRNLLSRVMPAVDLVHSQPMRRISAEEAARLCRLSRVQFDRVFARAMGISFGRFALRARLAFAADQLINTGLSIEDIAEQAGFVDASHLHRYFLKHYGVTPGGYRARFGRGSH